MPPPGRHERRVLRKASGLRARSRRRRKDEVHGVTIDFTDPAVARRWRRRTLLAISLGAAVGITWYALAPGVASYQIGYTLALPALVTAIVWIGKRLPRWLDWVIAVVVGEYLGSSRGVGYLISQAEGVFDTTGVFAGMAVLSAAVLLVGMGVNRLEKWLLRWKS